MPEQTPLVDGQIIDSARKGDVVTLAKLLDEHPEKLHLKVPPYEASLLFPAVQGGHVDAVDLLLDAWIGASLEQQPNHIGVALSSC
jgi:hypothetical protein